LSDRIDALNRRGRRREVSQECAMKRFGSFRLDPVNECLLRDGDGERLPLTPKAFAVLNHLIARAGRLVTKDELMEAVWPGTYVQEEILKTYVRKLRGVLGDDAENPSFIGTQTGRGYRFVAPVTEDRSEPPESAPVQTHKRLFGRDTSSPISRPVIREP
jgi:DNA-binding winged helix-turn-helix (wHTH) protein